MTDSESSTARTGQGVLAEEKPPLRPWIVIAAYNEERRLGNVLAGLLPNYDQIVVVDDGSRDRTVSIVEKFPVWLLQHPINRGQGAALQTGIDFALQQGATMIVTFDADGQHCVEDIPKLLEPLATGRAEIVLGSRFLGDTIGMPTSRWLVLKAGVLFTRVFSQIALTDTHNGLRAFSRLAAERIRITQDRMAHASEIIDQIARQELPYCEVPVTIRYHAETLAKGQSSWNAFKIVGQLLLGRLIR